MKIQHSKKMDDFFNRCLRNMSQSQLNAYLGKSVTPENEEYFQKKLKKAGAQEFLVDKQNWPSLYIDVDQWKNSLYHKNISLENVQTEHFSYVKETIHENELFNVDVIQKDINKELADWMKLRALNKPVEAIYLLQDGYDWMLDAPSEAITNDPAAAKSHGNVITFGLGIGYFIYMASQNKNVSSITVVEKNKEVIDLFNDVLLPQFHLTKPLHIIQADAFDIFNRESLQSYDYCYVDIWQSSDDGLFMIEKLLEQYNPPIDSCDFWIEDSCFNPIWSLIFVHFDELYHDRMNPVYEEYAQIMFKIRNYFKHINVTVSDQNELKHYMYDNQTIRNILSGK